MKVDTSERLKRYTATATFYAAFFVVVAMTFASAHGTSLPGLLSSMRLA